MTVTMDLCPSSKINRESEGWSVVHERMILAVLAAVGDRRTLTRRIELRDVLQPIRIHPAAQVPFDEEPLIDGNDHGLEAKGDEVGEDAFLVQAP